MVTPMKREPSPWSVETPQPEPPGTPAQPHRPDGPDLPPERPTLPAEEPMEAPLHVPHTHVDLPHQTPEFDPRKTRA